MQEKGADPAITQSNHNPRSSRFMKEPLLRDSTFVESDTKVIEERKFIPFQNPDNIENMESNPFPSNIIVTSRYTLFSFIPKAMMEQFRRMANIYFLVLGTIALIGQLTHYYATSVEASGLLFPIWPGSIICHRSRFLMFPKQRGHD